MSGPFKMKGSPMARNFGIGSPLTKNTEPTSGGTTASMKVNETTGKSEMITVVSNKKKADALQTAQDKVFAYNKSNKGKPGYKRQTFAKNISKDNKYIN